MEHYNFSPNHHGSSSAEVRIKFCKLLVTKLTGGTFSLQTCIERRLDPLFERDNNGGRLFVAPRPASKLFNNDGERAQMNAWNDETVKTPSLFNVFFVGRET